MLVFFIGVAYPLPPTTRFVPGLGAAVAVGHQQDDYGALVPAYETLAPSSFRGRRMFAVCGAWVPLCETGAPFMRVLATALS